MYKTAPEQTHPYVVFGSVFPATPVTDAHLVDPIEKACVACKDGPQATQLKHRVNKKKKEKLKPITLTQTHTPGLGLYYTGARAGQAAAAAATN